MLLIIESPRKQLRLKVDAMLFWIFLFNSFRTEGAFFKIIQAYVDDNSPSQIIEGYESRHWKFDFVCRVLIRVVKYLMDDDELTSHSEPDSDWTTRLSSIENFSVAIAKDLES